MKIKVFNKNEYHFLFSICSALGLRQLAMLLVMPIIAIYAQGLRGSTPALSGLAVGIFGLTQAFFQIPYGILSDRFQKRKPFVLIGLIQLVLGLILAGLSKNIYMLILGRALQGSGGIQSVSYAWISDKIHENKRNQAMEMAGIVIGFTAVFGFLFGSLLNKIISVKTIFILCAVMVTVSGICIVLFTNDIKNAKVSKRRLTNNTTPLRLLANNKKLCGYVLMGFLMNYMMISIFFIAPQVLEKSLGIDNLWKVFVPATIIGIILMRVLNSYVRKGFSFITCLIAYIFLAVATMSLFFNSVWIISIGMYSFMTAYIFLSTLLPTNITRLIDQENTGMATGIFHTIQFFATFVGGSVSGILWGIDMKFALLAMLFVCFIGIIAVKFIICDEENNK
jgi:MFS family permease